ncbi:MAG: glycoside hydrolase family 5 protein [Treponema sp.]|jgi:endoglucanase|nr:glycoside hydrolase family 5 protein [Treponema sp.]
MMNIPFSRGFNFSKWFESRTFKDIVFGNFAEQDFVNVKSMGADLIRVPIAFHNFTLGEKNHTLENGLLKYLDTAVDWAEKHELYIILDNHSFHPINPTDVNIDKILIPVWEQIADHFNDRGNYVIYEILNEPHGISDERWNEIQEAAVKTIRKADKKHTIIVGGTNYNSLEKMTKIPVYKDENLIYTFHFYDPHIFTHQGASWNRPSLEPLSGLPFPFDKNKIPKPHETFIGTWVEDSLNSYEEDSKLTKLSSSLDKAAEFSKERNVPVFCGEFGAFMKQSPPYDRVKWYKFISEELEKRNIPWASWDYFGGFGIFKTERKGDFPSDVNIDLVNAMGLKI